MTLSTHVAKHKVTFSFLSRIFFVGHVFSHVFFRRPQTIYETKFVVQTARKKRMASSSSAAAADPVLQQFNLPRRSVNWLEVLEEGNFESNCDEARVSLLTARSNKKYKGLSTAETLQSLREGARLGISAGCLVPWPLCSEPCIQRVHPHTKVPQCPYNASLAFVYINDDRKLEVGFYVCAGCDPKTRLEDGLEAYDIHVDHAFWQIKKDRRVRDKSGSFLSNFPSLLKEAQEQQRQAKIKEATKAQASLGDPVTQEMVNEARKAWEAMKGVPNYDKTIVDTKTHLKARYEELKTVFERQEQDEDDDAQALKEELARVKEELARLKRKTPSTPEPPKKPAKKAKKGKQAPKSVPQTRRKTRRSSKAGAEQGGAIPGIPIDVDLSEDEDSDPEFDNGDLESDEDMA